MLPMTSLQLILSDTLTRVLYSYFDNSICTVATSLLLPTQKNVHLFSFAHASSGWDPLPSYFLYTTHIYILFYFYNLYRPIFFYTYIQDDNSEVLFLTREKVVDVLLLDICFLHLKIREFVHGLLIVEEFLCISRGFYVIIPQSCATLAW